VPSAVNPSARSSNAKKEVVPDHREKPLFGMGWFNVIVSGEFETDSIRFKSRPFQPIRLHSFATDHQPSDHGEFQQFL
jgi:hypothetical protein